MLPADRRQWHVLHAQEAAAALEWFHRFAGFMKDGLALCGFAPCPANYMADNPRWNQPLAVWRE